MARAVAHALRQRVLAGAQLGAPQRHGGVRLEQARVLDHARVLEQLADLAGVGARRDGHDHGAGRLALERLEGLVDQPQRAADRRQREHGQHAPAPATGPRARPLPAVTPAGARPRGGRPGALRLVFVLGFGGGITGSGAGRARGDPTRPRRPLQAIRAETPAWPAVQRAAPGRTRSPPRRRAGSTGSGRARSTRNGSSLLGAGSGGCASRAMNVSGGGAFSPRRAARSAAARARSSGVRSGGVGSRRGTLLPPHCGEEAGLKRSAPPYPGRKRR